MRDWSGVVIHHSLSHDVPWVEIDRWHRERGFRQIGYHYVIRRDGTIEPGRPLSLIGAHARSPKPSRNTSHIGVCLTGDYSRDPPSEAQMLAVIFCVRGLRRRFDIGVDRIERHHDTCPGVMFPWDDFVYQIMVEEVYQ